jgi:hypothetical protein
MAHTEPPDQERVRAEAARLLGVDPGSGREVIHAAYRRAAKQWHPDRFVGRPDAQRAAEDRFRAVNAAYRLLLTTAPVSERPRPPVCPLHTADMVYTCPRCGQLACPACLVGSGCCRCPAEPSPIRFRLDVLWLWGLLAAGSLGTGTLGWTAGSRLWALWGYLAVVGGTTLSEKPWWARLWLVAFPVSLPLFGAWHLLMGITGSPPVDGGSPRAHDHRRAHRPPHRAGR